MMNRRSHAAKRNVSGANNNDDDDDEEDSPHSSASSVAVMYDAVLINATPIELGRFLH